MRVYVVRKWPLRVEKSFCVLEYHTSKSVVTVQRAFRAKYAKDPPTDKTIRACYKQFTKTGCLCKQKWSGRPLIAENDVERIRASFLRSPKKSMRLQMCAMSPVVHTSNISSCQHKKKKKLFTVFLWLWTISLRKVLWFSCYKCL